MRGAARSAWRLLAFALALAAAALGTARCKRDADAPPPDVLVLVMDTTRADRCGFLGYDRPTTPELDRFAAGAIVFEDAWSPSPWTLPAHVALFSGRLPSMLGIADASRGKLPADVPVLAALLDAAGWDTACFTGNAWIGPHTGLTRGFRRVDSLYAAAAGPQAREAHQRALRWMLDRRKAGRRFFAFINDVEPHAPWDPPDDLVAKFLRPGPSPELVARLRAKATMSPATTDRPDVRDPAVLSAATDLYDGEVAGLDREVGSLLGAMRAEGLLDGTLVVIAGDHGEGLGDHGWMEHGLYVHRELLRVPLVLRLPAGGEPRRVRELVRLEDVMPTVLDLCRVPAPAGLDGRSLVGDLSGRVAMATERVPASMCARAEELLGPAGPELVRRVRRSVFDGRWHLLVDDAGGAELFDVKRDPHEKNDLAKERPADVARLRAMLRPLPAR